MSVTTANAAIIQAFLASDGYTESEQHAPGLILAAVEGGERWAAAADLALQAARERIESVEWFRPEAKQSALDRLAVAERAVEEAR